LAWKAEVGGLTSAHGTAAGQTKQARVRFQEAERNLASVQALHLASGLVPGEPCTVCGASDHPAPATGKAEHAGRDQEFRDAKATWEQAEAAARGVAGKLTKAETILRERQDQLVSLDPPEDSVAVLKERIDAGQQALDGLEPETDLAEAEAEIERLSEEVESLGQERDALRDALVARQKQTVAERARRDEMLSSVPNPLRNPEELAAAHEKAPQKLTELQAARASVEKTATETREAEIKAGKELDAAEIALTTCKDRHRKAVEVFQSRLKQAGLLEAEFQALEPAIASIEEDQEAVNKYRRKLENAKEMAQKAAEIIREKTRPDLAEIKTKHQESVNKFSDATNLRSGAWSRLNHLRKLRNELAETLRKLDEAEAASGPLRHLAALVNGGNMQKLDLETFAIGAMFDQVLEAANLRLAPMTRNQYRLERDFEGNGRGRRGLGTQVFDSHTAKSRSTSTLSGGESFIAALALALGLADIVESASGKVRLDTIFIDEGFGSLDTENGSGTLDQVLQVLGSLVSRNRAVGLISHVPLVQEAIPNGFYVKKHLAGSSVETRGVV